MQKIFTLLLFFLSAAACAKPSCPTSHLQPLVSYGEAFYDPRPITNYDLALPDEKVVFQFMEFGRRDDSYGPIYSVTLLASKDSNYRVAIVRTRGKNVGETTKAFAAYQPVPSELAIKITNAMSQALRNTRYPEEPCTTEWLDGFVAQAILFNSDIGTMAGEVYSPTDSTEAGALVSLGRTLGKYADGKGNASNLKKALKNLVALSTMYRKASRSTSSANAVK